MTKCTCILIIMIMILSIESDHKQLSGDVNADDKQLKLEKHNNNVTYHNILIVKFNVGLPFFVINPQ